MVHHGSWYLCGHTVQQAEAIAKLDDRLVTLVTDDVVL